MPNTLDSRIRNAVDKFATELTELVRTSTLERVESALSGSAASRRKRGGPAPVKATAPRARGRRKGQKRSPAQIERLQARLLAAIKANPGLRKEQLGEALRAPTKDLMLVTNKLLEAGAIRKRGVKRATTYYPR